MERKKFIHVSFDMVEEFVPRIPEQRADGEDDSMPRICCIPLMHEKIRYFYRNHLIETCINSIPAGTTALQNALIAGLPIYVMLYTLEADDYILDTKRYVPDADISDEAWILQKPLSVQKEVFLIKKADFCRNEHNVLIVKDLKSYTVRNQNIDNWTAFRRFRSIDRKRMEKIKEIVQEKNLSYNTFLRSGILNLEI